MTRPSLASYLTNNVLVLTVMLPLLAPFGLTRNVTLQAVVVTITGLLAWTAVLLVSRWHNCWLHWLVTVYSLACVLSLIVHFSSVNAIGTPLIRLGSIELLACVGIGLSLRSVSVSRLMVSLYSSIATLTLVSVPYTLLHSHHWVRIGGLLFQPDFLAIVIAVGILLGIRLWQRYMKYRLMLGVVQVCLVTALFLTQTRAVIALLVCILLVKTALHHGSLVRKLACVGALLLLTAAGLQAVKPLTTGRLTDATFATQSVTYRLALQEVGMQHLTDQPQVGYGSGSIQKPLACAHIKIPVLQETCRSGYYFDSTHNVYLDRLLSLGWLGGLSFILVSGLLLYRGFRQPGDHLFSLCALLIALYYCTNISFIEIELLYWICLLRGSINSVDKDAA